MSGGMYWSLVWPKEPTVENHSVKKDFNAKIWSQLAFILSTGIKDKGLIHSLPTDMITQQVSPRRKWKLLDQWSNSSIQWVVTQLILWLPVGYDLMSHIFTPPTRHFQIMFPFYLFVIWCFIFISQHPPSPLTHCRSSVQGHKSASSIPLTLGTEFA